MKYAEFPLYDIVGYLLSGIVFLFAYDRIWDVAWIDAAALDLEKGLLMAGAAYIVGHMLSGPAAWIGCWRFQHPRSSAYWQIIPKPHEEQSSKEKSFRDRLGIWRNRINPLSWWGYYSPIPEALIDEIRDRIGVIKLDTVKLDAKEQQLAADRLYYTAMQVLRRDEVASARYEDIRRQRIFSRNLSFVALISGLLFLSQWLIHGLRGGQWDSPDGFLALAFAVAVMMYLRFLLFTRDQVSECYITYAFTQHHEPERDSADISFKVALHRPTPRDSAERSVAAHNGVGYR
jgi:hypothetical protein